MVKYSVLITIIFLSCSPPKEVRDKTIISVAEVVGTGEILNLSDYAKSIRYIPLETTDSVLVGNIEELFYEENKILLYDFQTKRCKQFDQNGNFNTFIGRIGQGPGEYSYINALSFIPKTEETFLSIDQGYLIYGSDGALSTYIPQVKTENTYWDATTVAITNTLFFSQIVAPKDRQYHALIWGKNENDSIYQLIPNYARINFKGEPRSFTVSTTKWRFRNQIRSYWSETDTIYTVSDNAEFNKAFVLDFGKYKQSIEYCLGAGKDYEKKNTIGLLNKGYAESLNYLFFSFQFGDLAPERFSHEVINMRTKKKVIVEETKVYALFDKRTGKLTLLNQPVKHKYLGFRNDLDGGPCFWPKYISAKDEMITWFMAEEFLEIYEQLPNPSPELKAVAEKLSPDDNPVLMVVQLK